MKLHELKQGDTFTFEGAHIFAPHKVISKDERKCRVKTPSGSTEVFRDQNHEVNKYEECYSCPGSGCTACFGYGYIPSI